MKIKIYTNTDFHKNVYPLLSFPEDYVADGFYYCTLSNIMNTNYNHIFIVAWIDNQPIGIIKFSDKGYESYNIWNISWIDIRQDYKNKGVATALLSFLDEYLKNKNYILLVTDFSNEGAKYIKQKIITFKNAKVFINNEDFYNFYKNHLQTPTNVV